MVTATASTIQNNHSFLPSKTTPPQPFMIRRVAGAFQTVKEPLGGIGGPQPSDCFPKPAACIAAQTQPSVGFGLRRCGSVLRCPHASVRFAHPSGGFGTLAQQGFLSPFAARRAEGEKANGAKVVKKVAIGEFFDELQRPRSLSRSEGLRGRLASCHQSPRQMPMSRAVATTGLSFSTGLGTPAISLSLLWVIWLPLRATVTP